NVSCNDASDGSIDIDITGGTFPYTPTWVHDQSGATYVNIEDLSDVPCGTYELTVVDDNGCTFNTEVELTCVPEFVVDVTTVPNPCGDPDALLGEIHVVVSGSHGGPYTLDWAGPSCPCAGPDLLNLTSGNYTLTITDIIGCEFVQVINVGTNDQFTVSETITDATCGGLCDGSIEIDIAGVPVDATEWTGPDGFTSSDEDIFDLCAGSYILNITSGTCEEQFVFIVGEPDPIDVDFINIVPPICFGQNNGSLDITTSGGTGILTSEWFEQPECFFPATSGNSLSNLFECTYVVEVTDALGCSIQDSLFLDAPQVMDIFVSLSDFGGPYQISCNGESDGAISVSVDGGTQDCVTFDPECYFYDWTNCDAVNLPGVSQQSDLPAGSYCVVVTDANGCVATTEIDLVEPDPIESSGSISDYNGFGVSCFGECDGWITPAVIGGNDSYVLFDWIAGDIGANASDADTLFNLCPGIYELRVVDINDCEDVISFEITEPDALELSVDLVVDVSCYDYSDGELSVSATGGTGVYDFDWNNGEFNGQDLVGLPGGEYDLDLTDQNGCLLEQLVIVEEPDTFLVTLTVPILEGAAFTIPCKGDSTGAIFTSIQGGVPDLDILWTGGFFDDPTMADQSGLPAGTYTIDVTDADGCIATATAEITEPDEFLEVTSSVESLLCFGDCNGTVDLLVTGGVLPYTFIWELDNNGDTLSTLQNQTDLCAGMYEVLVSDANGCDTLLSFNFTSPEEILSNSVLSDHNGFNVSCPEACDGSITIAPSGGTGVITFTWLLNGEEVSEGATTLLGLCAGDVINLTLTDENDCVIEEVYVISSPEPIVANEVVVNLDCVGTETGSITLNPTGGDGSYTYEWTPDFGNVSEIEDLVPGQYCVVITDGNDCSIDMCWDITQPEQVTLSETSTDTNCGACDGSIELTVLTGLAPYSIIWTGPSSIDDDELNPTDLCQGVYTASVTDDNGCSEEIEITIEGIEAIDPGVELTQPLCYGDCNGSIQLNITNGTEPFTIVWTDLTTNEIVSNDELLDGICSGNFQLDIEDSLGCTFSDTYSIVEPSEIMINGLSPIFSNGYNVSTLDGTDGFIQTNVTGGTPDYSYDWSGPIAIDADVASPQFLPAGDYMLTVSDMNGCTKDTLFVLTQPEDLALPTGLSPNGDGANDTYVILGIDQYPSNDFKVFNRWGNLVYEKTNYNNEWAGTNTDGEELPDGTYYVIFTASEREFATYVDLRR
ncbi:MAG: gliding motility-associated C-terminal domain-containing protein, partial [Flavobacteriales bacterium]